MNSLEDGGISRRPIGVSVVLLESSYGSSEFDRLAELKDRLLEAINVSAIALLIDMSQTISIGCGFLSVIVQCHVEAKARKCRLSFCSFNSLPEEVFAITRLGSIWEVFRDQEDALVAMAGFVRDDIDDATPTERIAGTTGS